MEVMFAIPIHVFLLLFSAITVKAVFKLQILHTNDMHARFDETDQYGGTCPPNETNCFGGFARVKQAVEDSKKAAALSGYPSIFLNAGDTFQGTAYYTFFKGEIVAPFINMLGIDVMVSET